jgi:diaminopimelate decarboxylase
MNPKPPPFSAAEIGAIAARFPTPFHLYREDTLLETVHRLTRAFSWNRGFKEYFAVKATPNPFLLTLLAQAGLGMDCSSRAELELCDGIGVRGEEVMFTSNNTPAAEYQRARELGAIINLDDLTQIEFLHRHAGVPALISFRLNPGDALAGSEIIGTPREAKFGLTRVQLRDAYASAKQLGATRFGLHSMPISNQLEESYFADTVTLLLETVCELSAQLGITFEFINMGGGIGIPYRPEENAVNIEALSQQIARAYQRTLSGTGLPEPRLFMECGRYITGPSGFLVTRAIHSKDIFRRYIGVDASMADLMRPGMYGAYHHISVLGKEHVALSETYDVVGSLCENNDKFAVQRPLPPIEAGDLVVIHDTGAHGHAMGFNYNGKLRSAELLLRTDGSVVQIRRPETLADHFATLDLESARNFTLLGA